MSVNVLPRGAAEPVVSAVERGRRLFEGKGCATCHKHPEFSSVRTVDVHDMTDRRYTSEHVQAFLLSLPSRTASIESFGTMPNLGLARHEVEALAAFLGR
jgi:cytochrome c peroxidase